ncbi:insulin receptor substrate 1 isoform X2 [Amia ocellicauda]|uniref:insulin receptor substrate 1 isoform X2 n=1 Tax=Amia ocellicauda TaxID=2972642 RepID=UPI003463AA4E
METPPPEPCCEDVRKCGYLRKQKSMHRRYFVLRAASHRGPARLECYENEKKFRGKSPVPKKALNLETCFNINKRADAKNKHLIVVYTREESFAIAADSEAGQAEWYDAMVELQCKSKSPTECPQYGGPGPGPAFKEVWQVKLWPKGLGQAKSLAGVYRLCLTERTVSFVRLHSEVAAVVLQLLNVRRCGHSENFFFVEVGRSAVTGPGEFWMQVDDAVVAQNMHETLLDAMKALSEEFRQRTKSQSSSANANAAAATGATQASPAPTSSSSASSSSSTTTVSSHPISVPSRRHHSHPHPPPSQVGLPRRPRTDTGGAGGSSSTSPLAKTFPRARTASDSRRARMEEAGGGAQGARGGGSPDRSSSCSTTPKSVRACTPAKTPLGLARATPVPPSAECGAEAASGSPSDYGSSDEYGSSPGEPSPRPPGPPHPLSLSLSLLSSPDDLLPGASAFHQPESDCTSNYIAMGRRSVARQPQQHHHHQTPLSQNPGSQARRVLRRSSSRESEAERRLLSKRASLPPMDLEKLTPGPPGRRPGRGAGDGGGRTVEAEEEDYAVMSRSVSQESFGRRQDSEGGAYMELPSPGMGPRDNGYMSMLPGVTGAGEGGGGDYMAMTPNNSVSPPQQIQAPARHRAPSPAPSPSPSPSLSDGYMMMSPSSSCSPDQRGVGGPGGPSWGADGPRLGGDYMNMSPLSGRSASGAPPAPQPSQPPPKMVFSYYSLPRSYKHVPPAGFEEAGGGEGGRKGRLPSSSSTSGGLSNGTGPPGSRRGPEGGGGRPLFSSCSYSSSSTSSESLGEAGEEAPTQGKGGSGAGARGGPAPSAGGQQWKKPRSRPVSLFVDVSRANTLPRVREAPPPAEPKSPGEYVSIDFRAGALGGLAMPSSSSSSSSSPFSSRPPSSTAVLGGGIHGQRSPSAPPHLHTLTQPRMEPPASEYVNMDLGPPPAVPGYPPTHPTPAMAPLSLPQRRPERGAANGGGKNLASAPTEPPAAFGDYTTMAFSRGPQTPTAASPEPSRGLELDFPPAKGGPNPDQGAKLVRADPQGRRRHGSETFQPLPPPPPPSASSLLPFPDSSRLGLDSAPPEAPSQGPAPGPLPLPAAQAPSCLEQGLNYIDLDLVPKEPPHSGPEGVLPAQLPPRLFSSVLGAGGGPAGLAGGGQAAAVNTYASIDFYKSEELRAQQGQGSGDGTEC